MSVSRSKLLYYGFVAKSTATLKIKVKARELFPYRIFHLYHHHLYHYGHQKCFHISPFYLRKIKCTHTHSDRDRKKERMSDRQNAKVVLKRLLSLNVETKVYQHFKSLRRSITSVCHHHECVCMAGARYRIPGIYTCKTYEPVRQHLRSNILTNIFIVYIILLTQTNGNS